MILVITFTLYINVTYYYLYKDGLRNANVTLTPQGL